jgi:hypothetical protein
MCTDAMKPPQDIPQQSSINMPSLRGSNPNQAQLTLMCNAALGLCVLLEFPSDGNSQVSKGLNQLQIQNRDYETQYRGSSLSLTNHVTPAMCFSRQS